MEQSMFMQRVPLSLAVNHGTTSCTFNRSRSGDQISNLNINLQLLFRNISIKVRKRAKIRNRYNQAPQLTQDNNGESDNVTIRHHIQESQEVSPFQAGDHMASTNKRA